jgi:hypothetical protein
MSASSASMTMAVAGRNGNLDQGATGYWLLAAGCWLLATGYWLLATG